MTSTVRAQFLLLGPVSLLNNHRLRQKPVQLRNARYAEDSLALVGSGEESSTAPHFVSNRQTYFIFLTLVKNF